MSDIEDIDREDALAELEEVVAEKPSRKTTPEQSERETAEFNALVTLERLKSGTLSKRRAKEHKEKLLRELAEIDDETFKVLMGDPEVSETLHTLAASSGGQPGDPIYDAKGREIDRVPYTAEWFQEHYTMVDWTPMEDAEISVNGVAFKVFGGMVNKVPNVIRDVGMESQRLKREAEREQVAFMADLGAEGTSRDVGWRKAEITGNSPGWHER